MSTCDESEAELSHQLEEKDSDFASHLVVSQLISESIESNKRKVVKN